MNTRIFLLLFVVLGCQNRPSTPLVKSSNGNINTISVVMPDLLWETEVGDAARAASGGGAAGDEERRGAAGHAAGGQVERARLRRRHAREQTRGEVARLNAVCPD